MDKNALRTKYKNLRSQLKDKDVEQLSLDIANRLLDLSIWDKAFYHVFLTIAKKKEIDTEFILHILQGKDKNVVVSKSDFTDYSLSHFLLTDTTVIQVNTWGIPEPKDGISITENMIEVVFVPLLAFDHKGNRIGYGKGFYDKFLAKCKPETLKIGLSLFPAEKKITGILPTDIPLDYCVTPTEVYTFD